MKSINKGPLAALLDDHLVESVVLWINRSAVQQHLVMHVGALGQTTAADGGDLVSAPYALANFGLESLLIVRVAGLEAIPVVNLDCVAETGSPARRRHC